MQNITNIYNHYELLINLQEHQRRVAAVGKIIGDNFIGPLDREGVVKACLLHDMGNIIKFNLDIYTKFPDLDDEAFFEEMKKNWLSIFGPFEESANIYVESLRKNGRDYWLRVKEKYIEKYGSDEHAATIAIARELHMPESIISYLDGVGFSDLDKTCADPSFEKKICSYSDMRVAIYGVNSIGKRLEDAKKRYAKTGHSIASERYDMLAESLYKIEEQIQAHVSLDLNSITSDQVEALAEELKEYQL